MKDWTRHDDRADALCELKRAARIFGRDSREGDGTIACNELCLAALEYAGTFVRPIKDA